jgi:phosphomannomutase
MSQQIKFGTDGWRAVIADDFTYENLRRVAHAIACYVHQYEEPSQGVLIAYDTRFGSRRFAEVVAEAIASTGIRVLLAREVTPTPALSFMVRQRGAAGGVMITSSHNPWDWNGVKFKASYGGAATPEIMRRIEDLVDAPHVEAPGGSVTEADFKTDYIRALCEFVDLKAIAQAGHNFTIDSMYGAGSGIISGIFQEIGVRHIEIHANMDPLFPGLNPEPILPHLHDLQEAVLVNRSDAGLVTDGDADRIAAVAEDACVVDAHKCFAILLEWLLERKQWPGVITRAFNTTGMLDRIANAHGRELIEHGIGFKHVAQIILSGKRVLIGGEESGGIGIPRFLPERDGILNALLLANVMADEDKTIGHLVDDLQEKYGPHYYGRRDLHLDEPTKFDALQRAAARPSHIGRYRVHHVEDLDGYKFFLNLPLRRNGAEPWLLLRGSGTEPLLRVYCEAASPETVSDILDAAVTFVNSGAPHLP